MQNIKPITDRNSQIKTMIIGHNLLANTLPNNKNDFNIRNTFS